MSTLKSLTDELRVLLSHLYDPTHPFPSLVAAALGVTPAQGVEAVQRAIIHSMRDMKPPGEVPRRARVWRLYRLLLLRYLEQATQEEAAEHLGITARHLAREQTKAIDLLVLRLLQTNAGGTRFRGEPGLCADALPRCAEPGTELAETRHPQLEKELDSLRQQAPSPVSDVGKVLGQVVSITRVFAEKHDITLELVPLESAYTVPVHHSVLSQALVGAVTYLAQGMSYGQIELSARTTPGSVEIMIMGEPTTAPFPPANWLGRELLDSQGGSLQCHRHDDSLSICCTLPSAPRATVLVVDDNEDLVHFYRACTMNTVFQVVHLREGRSIFETLETVQPDIIVLDLMLPDISGLEVLAQLSEHPFSKSIPIIVCSVVREEELAFALGATAYIPKPVRRRQFVRVLTQLLSQVGRAEPRAPESNAATC